MSANSSIEWTDTTWNIATGCTKVSAGCEHCYIERTPPFRMTGRRFDQPGIGGATGVELHPERLTQPFRWRNPRKVFVNSLSDLFHADVPDEFIARVFAVMAIAQRHTFQLLTKRHARMRTLLNSPEFWASVGPHMSEIVGAPTQIDKARALPNVWLGVSVESQQWADIRIPVLLDTPAAVRFLSCEPLLSALSLEQWMPPGMAFWQCGGCRAFFGGQHQERCPNCDRFGYWTGSHAGNGHNLGQPIDWVIAGGESGTGARPMHPGWARALRDQCTAAGVPFLFKQWGNWAPFPVYKGAEKNTFVMDAATGEGAHYALRNQPGYAEMWNVGKKEAGRELDGRTWDEYPTAPLTAAVRGGS